MTPKLALTALFLLLFVLTLFSTHTEYKDGHYQKAIILGSIAGYTFGMALAVFMLYETCE